MTIPIESILSGLSLLLATIASLRAASRLDARIVNGGAVGLMDGPPILGPFDTIIGNGTIQDVISNVSPLWEQSEGFRRAVVLGMLSDSTDGDALSRFFTKVHRHDDTIDKDKEFAIAAAIDAGLLVPTGGASTKAKHSDMKDVASSNNPLIALTTWFARELSAPFSAIPAWHGILCSFLKEQRKIRQSKWTISNMWRRWKGTFYDSSECDFHSFISGMAHLPCVKLDVIRNVTMTSKSVRVKAYAPNTFRDLRNRCFRVSERQYAHSIFNLMDNTLISEDEPYQNNLLFDSNDELLTHERTVIPQTLTQIIGHRKSSTTQTLPYISFQSNSKGAARAGTFFFFTADGAYMIKTVKKEEAKAFLEMLPEYHRFMSNRENGRNTLLTRIFGMYSVQFIEEGADQKMRWNGGIYSHDNEETKKSDCEERVFLVMSSVFPAEASAFVTERFDLKGSTVGRECSTEEQKAKGTNAVLKDLNLKREVDEDRKKNQQAYGIHIGKRKKVAFMAQLKKDVDLLNRCGVLDYSLLVGSADMGKLCSWSKTQPKHMHSIFTSAMHKLIQWMDTPMPYYGSSMTKVDGGHLSCLLGTRRGEQVMFYMGIIDFLQPWTVKKRLERDLKGLAGYDTRAISCVAPSAYASRFLQFIEEHVT